MAYLRLLHESRKREKNESSSPNIKEKAKKSIKGRSAAAATSGFWWSDTGTDSGSFGDSCNDGGSDGGGCD
ncbi:hypothetical protein [Fictibacillus fluitans]|uniref:Uncharacterized protein n=1 Tax=Fictibacillus fluitans TaxID=3058422 RepID=A0ABT8I3F1_9BACL|nr:hypothetical protein [Fictibacillus sp. NE201]MDN4527568.1 hypothetical protein [Fictibacillus sp. NE201]